MASADNTRICVGFEIKRGTKGGRGWIEGSKNAHAPSNPLLPRARSEELYKNYLIYVI